MQMQELTSKSAVLVRRESESLEAHAPARWSCEALCSYLAGSASRASFITVSAGVVGQPKTEATPVRPTEG